MRPRLTMEAVLRHPYAAVTQVNATAVDGILVETGRNPGLAPTRRSWSDRGRVRCFCAIGGVGKSTCALRPPMYAGHPDSPRRGSRNGVQLGECDRARPPGRSRACLSMVVR